MITPTRFEVSCVGWDCDPDRYPHAPVWTRPLVVDARSVREAGKLARAAGWSPSCSKGEWWCPRHAAMSGAAVRAGIPSATNRFRKRNDSATRSN